MPDGRNERIRTALERLLRLYLDARGLSADPGGIIAARVLMETLRKELLSLGYTAEQLRSAERSYRTAAETIAAVHEAPPLVLPTVDAGHESRVAKRTRRAQARTIVREVANGSGVRFTTGAAQILVIPVVESYELSGRWNETQIRESLEKIAETLKSEEVDASIKKKTSIDVIRGFVKNFCNIPPFCGRNISASKTEG